MAKASKAEQHQRQDEEALPLAVPWAHAALIAGAVAPLFLPVNTNVNVIATATLTVYIGCHRSVKPDPPEDSMSQSVRGSAGSRRNLGKSCRPLCSQSWTSC